MLCHSMAGANSERCLGSMSQNISALINEDGGLSCQNDVPVQSRIICSGLPRFASLRPKLCSLQHDDGSNWQVSECGFNQIKSLKDRKSTRLNSSHANISYAVFCLKKKK